MSVILPDPGMSGEGLPHAIQPQRYPTLYLLHGMSDDHTTWQRRTAIERYAERLNLAIVMPAVQRSFYADTVTGQRYWTFIGEELPFLARSFFPLSERREETYVAGLSTGGYGAFKLAMTYPERYAAAASLSGTLDVVRLATAEEETEGGELKYIFGEARGLVGSPNDLFSLAKRLAETGRESPSLYQWCGTDDFWYADNVRFRAHLQALRLAVTYTEGPGTHDWAYWDQQIQRVLDWLPGVSRR